MKTRIISAIIAIAIVIPFIYFGGWLYAVGIGILAIVGFREFVNLKKSHDPFPFPIIAIAIIGMLLLIYTNFDSTSLKYGVTYMRIIFLSVGLFIPTILYKNDRYSSRDAFYLIGLCVFIGMAFNSFILVRDKGLITFLFLVLIPMITDTFALLVGMKFGKHKMAPVISPKKSWEGAIGGLVFGTVGPLIYYHFLIGPINYKVVLGIMFLSTMGQLGDLLFSKIKRENDIKDFSNLMPGHGGVFDRLDSTILVFISYIYITTILF